MNSKQIDELIELIDKEEILEVEDKIEKALQKDKEAKKAQKTAKDTKEKECTEMKEVSTPLKSPKMESNQTMVTPPPSIDKTKDSSKML